MLGEGLLTRATAWMVRVLAVVLMLAAHASPARASGACAAAFEQWVKLSETRIRKPAAQGALEAGRDKPAPAPSACIPGEAARMDLLHALAGVRGKCGATTPPDPTAPQTLTMIGINEGFIAAIDLCPAEVPPKAAPEPARAPAARPRRCLDIVRAAADRFLLVNRHCSGSRVLAIVETRAATGATECKAHLIDEKKTVGALGKSPPQINYECPVGQGKCSKEHLAVMFPECDW